jgi:hypothetical protein
MEVDAGIAERDWCIFRVRWAWRPVCGGVPAKRRVLASTMTRKASAAVRPVFGERGLFQCVIRQCPVGRARSASVLLSVSQLGSGPRSARGRRPVLVAQLN